MEKRENVEFDRGAFIDRVREGLADADAGRLDTHDAVVLRLTKRYGAPGTDEQSGTGSPVSARRPA